jgi:hypothetical protein
MWTRRAVLVAAALAGTAGTSLAAAFPLQPARGAGQGIRLGLLQSAEPFIDGRDLAGSRRRALAALQVLVARALADGGPLDWLACGPLPLSGAGPFPATALHALALVPACPEVRWLRRLAQREQVRLSLGAWWQRADGQVVPALVVGERNGDLGVWPWRQVATDLAARCQHLGVYGVRIQPAAPVMLPPMVSAVTGGETSLLGPGGEVLATAATRAETLVVADLPWQGAHAAEARLTGASP